MPDKDGEIIGIINKSSDVTLAQEKQASLKQAHDELEARVIQRTVELQQANE